MKRFVLTLLLPILTVLAVSAQYSLFDFQGAVKIERSGRPIAVEKGMRINGSDIFTIPSDGLSRFLIHPIPSCLNRHPPGALPLPA